MKTILGEAIRKQRGERSLPQVGRELGVSHQTVLRLERGDHSPTASTALKLARWLGWSVERVLEAAEEQTPEA